MRLNKYLAQNLQISRRNADEIIAAGHVKINRQKVSVGTIVTKDDVVEVDGKPGRIVRCGIWSTTFFTYDVVDGIIVGGSKLVIQNDKLKDIKIEKPLPLLDLSKYKVDTSCVDLLTELTRVVKKHENNIQ